MDNIITDDVNVVKYVVKVNGVEISTRFGERMMAEMAMNNLPDEQKTIAEVVSVTTDGKQLLLG